MTLRQVVDAQLDVLQLAVQGLRVLLELCGVIRCDLGQLRLDRVDQGDHRGDRVPDVLVEAAGTVVVSLVVVGVLVLALGPVVMGVVVVVPALRGLGGAGQVGDGDRVDDGGLRVQGVQHRRDERVVAAAIHDDHVCTRQGQLVAGGRLVLVRVLRGVVDDRLDLDGIPGDRGDDRGIDVRRGDDRRAVAVTRSGGLPSAARQQQGGQGKRGDEGVRAAHGECLSGPREPEQVRDPISRGRVFCRKATRAHCRALMQI